MTSNPFIRSFAAVFLLMGAQMQPIANAQMENDVILPHDPSSVPRLDGFSLTSPTPAQGNGNSFNLGTFTINIVPGTGLASNSAALLAFNRAAAQWSAAISDPITVTINADLSTNFASSNIIGSTSAVTLQGGYDTIRNAMVLDAAGNTTVAALPTAANFTASLPAGRSLSGNVIITKANAKALGFGGLDTSFGVSDATITFNSNFNFDYDNTNGVTAGQIDFETVAAHEIGHALGFTSSVDTIDTTTAATTPTISPTTLDLFRFGRLTNNPSTPAEFTSFPRDLNPGDDTITDDLTTEYPMSTGINGGDGRQASHWKDDALTGNFIGIMDPTLASGTTETVQTSDLRAMDVIGYDVNFAAVPEPTVLSFLGLGTCVGLLWKRQRAQRQASRTRTHDAV